MKTLLLTILAMPVVGLTGAAIVVKIAKRYWPPEKFGPMCEVGGVFVSTMGRSKLGRFFYEGIETYVQACLRVAHERFDIGLDKDDKKRKEASNAK